jgi:peptide/nickel transport system permease protein
MAKFLIKRCLMMILVLFASAIIIFSIMYFVPGDPAVLILGKGATPEQLEAKRAELGLDRPYLERLGAFLGNVFLRFDLGNSYQRGTPVMGEIIERLPRTLLVGFSSVILSALIGIPLGILAATHQGKVWDTLCLIIAMAGSALPGFWLALILILLFSLQLHWLPAFGIGTWKHYVLPIVASAFMGIGNNARQTRSSMLETMRADFITSARAKGASEARATYRHMLPNALIPVITVIGSAFGFVIAGSIIIETVFTIPGVGLLLMSGITNRDYPIIMGTVIFLSFMTSLIMLLVDLAYAFVDPRIKAGYRRKEKA